MPRVDLRVHPQHGRGGPRARGKPKVPREPVAERLVVEARRRVDLTLLPPTDYNMGVPWPGDLPTGGRGFARSSREDESPIRQRDRDVPVRRLRRSARSAAPGARPERIRLRVLRGGAAVPRWPGRRPGQRAPRRPAPWRHLAPRTRLPVLPSVVREGRLCLLRSRRSPQSLQSSPACRPASRS